MQGEYQLGGGTSSELQRTQRIEDLDMVPCPRQKEHSGLGNEGWEGAWLHVPLPPLPTNDLRATVPPAFETGLCWSPREHTWPVDAARVPMNFRL